MLQQFDALGPEYLASAGTGYTGGQAGEVYAAVLKLDDPAMFAEAEGLLANAPPLRRRQLYFILWLIAARLEDTPLKQRLIGHYYREQDENVARHLRHLFVQDSISHTGAPPPFDVLSLDVEPPASAGGELRYLELVAGYLNIYWRKAGSVTNLRDIADRMLRAENLPEARDCFFKTPRIMAKIGAACAHPDIEKNLTLKLSRVSKPEEQLPLAVAIAENFPLRENSNVTKTLLDLSAKRSQRSDAVRALSHAPCLDVEDTLIAILQDEKTGVELLATALRSLGATKSEKARPLIAEKLEHPKRDVRWAALAYLPAEGEWLSSWITRLDQERDPFLKGFALTGLLHDKSPAVRQAVLRFARKAVKTDIAQQMNARTFLHHAVRYLSEFRDDAEIATFLKTIPADLMEADSPIEARLTAGLH